MLIFYYSHETFCLSICLYVYISINIARRVKTIQFYAFPWHYQFIEYNNNNNIIIIIVEYQEDLHV